MTSQRHFRFRTDTGAADATPTWGANEDSNTFTPGASPFRLRLSLENPTHAATGSLPYQIYLSKNGGAYAAITTSSTNGIKSADAGSDADNTSIFIPRLTVPSWTALAGSAIDLDFANSQVYPSGIFADYLSCSRASVGYAKNAGGTLTQFSSNELRITDMGLLVEDARTNLVQASGDMSNGTYWTASQCATATTSATTAPDGTNDAVIQTENSAAAAHRNYTTNATFAIAANQVFTTSCYFKNGASNGRRYVALTINDANAQNRYTIIVDTVGGSVTDTHSINSPASPSYELEALADGWYRGSITMTNNANTAGGWMIICGSDSATPSYDGNGEPTYTGDGLSNFYIWGAQVELGVRASSYIPTTNVSAARGADVITDTGNLQTDIAAATGSIVAQIDNGKAVGVAANIVDSNGSNLLGFDATNHGLASIIATLATGNTGNRTTQDKLGLAWNASGRSLVLNGGTVATDATAQTPSSTQHIGSSGAANFVNAYIERLTVWTSKLADATLQGFTS